MNNELVNFIKYCLGYVKITRDRATLSQQKFSANLPTDYIQLAALLNGDLDGKLGELINLATFYQYDPKDVPDEELENYEKEKVLANTIENIYNKYKNDQYTKQIFLNFGYFEIEIPIDLTDEIVVLDEADQEETKVNKTKIDRYPLFALPIKIEKDFGEKGVGKYWVYSADPEIQVNIGMLEPILGPDLYFQLLEEMGKYEMEEKLTLPIASLDIFLDIWHKIKAQLRLKEAKFDEKSFSLEEIKIAISPKANYFLAEDLAKLTKLNEEDLSQTALTSWTQDEDLNIENDVPSEKELYFPFLYDKYQLSTLSILGNKASIIQGPPGTGKSETISNILCHLAATGKRVLFVSQKAQALKVVKDKLKKLDVKYLYGYLPNPNSAQIGEEDEADGIAPQLSALGAYITKLGYEFNTRNRLVGFVGDNAPIAPLNQIVDKKEQLGNHLNEAIDSQREYYQLNKELDTLEEFDLAISNAKNFTDNFSSEEWLSVKNLRIDIEKLGIIIKEYEESSEKKKFEKLFVALNLPEQRYAEIIEVIRDDVGKTGYDRHSSLFRRVNNLRRNIRLGKNREKLPREILDYIDSILVKDEPRSKQLKSINSLYNHCYFFENIRNLHGNEKQLKEKLSLCGLSNQEFQILDNKIESCKTIAELDDIKRKILRVWEIRVKLKELKNTESLNKISSVLKSAEQERIKRVGQYIQNIINKGIIDKWKTGVTIRQIVKKLASAFGKSKKAFKTFDNLRKDVNNFHAILDLIPVWIMELDDASRIIPLEPGIFDYVILDEASQCNVAYTLPVMYRTNRVLFVGDSEQMRDSTIMFKSNRIFDDLARRYQVPEERQIKATGSAVQSVLDIADKRGFMEKPLQYHYRSPAELIGFSNKYFYKPKGKELIPITHVTHQSLTIRNYNSDLIVAV